MALTFVSLIWDDATRLGCGISRNYETRKTFVVARYFPVETFARKLDIHVKPPLKYIFNKTSNVTFYFANQMDY